MKRQQDVAAPSQEQLEDAGDRAQKRRKQGMVRIPLDKIGFWPDNRGGLGMSSHHLHEVAWDCKANKTKLQRYGYVDLVEIPAGCLQQVLDANRQRCAKDALMPNAPRDLQYVCVSKTHFVHAQKLARDGNRFLFNQGKTGIRWQEDDTEGKQIEEQGPLCAIYDGGLFMDSAAMHALASEDNLNASVQWREDGMRGRRAGTPAPLVGSGPE